MPSLVDQTGDAKRRAPPLGDQSLLLAHGQDADIHLIEALSLSGIKTKLIKTNSGCSSYSCVLLDQSLLHRHDLASWIKQGCALLIPDELAEAAAEFPDASQLILLPKSPHMDLLVQAVKFGSQFTDLYRQSQSLDVQLKNKGKGLERLIGVGIALSAESDIDCLLAKILTEGQQLVGCDAASLFLLDETGDSPVLLFKLIRNSTMDVPFKEQRIALNKSSIAAYCAITGETLNIDDAYLIPEDSPYTFNRSFDLAMGYRSVNMVVLPMIDQQHKIVGVLQYINRKIDPEQKLTVPALTPSQVHSFDSDSVSLLQAMASQAAVAMENRRLLDEVKSLFDGFVQASVFAIERRDPTTSGHSFRVADLCESVATSFDASQTAELKKIKFNEDQMRELRYAALLHDFGKVGVREHILTKAKKLSAGSCELLRYRVALAKSQIENQSLTQLLNLALSTSGLNPSLRQEIEKQCHLDCEQLEHYFDIIMQANEPSMLPEGSFEHLEKIKSHLVRDCHGKLHGLISEHEFKSLSITRGSLSDEERLEIESHVQHTIDFLSLIPWTDKLAGVTAIAGAHHEKLDGSGYPQHLPANKIPFQSRIMTVCDIYDALTASDRPYKPAMPLERALSVLESESKRGIVDPTVVKVFIESQAYKALDGREYGFTLPQATKASKWVHHVCDYDLHRANDLF